jgi:membrane protein required for colicin V production
METINSIDWLIIGIFAFSMMLGLLRGFLREVLSLVSWVVAYIAATMFASQLAARFGGASVSSMASSAGVNVGAHGEILDKSASYLSTGISFAVIFFLTLIVCSMLTRVISYAVDSGALGVLNRLLGGVFGSARAGLVIVLMIFLVQFTPLSEKPVWLGSKFVVAFQPYVKLLENLVQPHLKDLKARAEGIAASAKDGLNAVTQGASVEDLGQKLKSVGQ